MGYCLTHSRSYYGNECEFCANGSILPKKKWVWVDCPNCYGRGTKPTHFGWETCWVCKGNKGWEEERWV